MYKFSHRFKLITIKSLQFMSFKTFYSAVKKRGLSVLLISFLIIIVFVPDAKSFLLQQLVSVGLFKAEIKKNGVNNLPETASFSFTNSAGITATTAGLKGKVVFIKFSVALYPPRLLLTKTEKWS